MSRSSLPTIEAAIGRFTLSTLLHFAVFFVEVRVFLVEANSFLVRPYLLSFGVAYAAVTVALTCKRFPLGKVRAALICVASVPHVLCTLGGAVNAG